MFLIAKMSQDFVYDVLVFYTSVRRIDYDSDRSAAVTTRLLPRACYHAPATTNLDIDVKHALESLLPRACAQVIAA
jgi:hypothetical protein